jgi:hypothetical protein
MEDDSGSTALAPSRTSSNELTFDMGKYGIKTIKFSLGGGTIGIGKCPISALAEISHFRLMLSTPGRQSAVTFTMVKGEVVRRIYVTNLLGRVVRTLYSGQTPLNAAEGLTWNGDGTAGVKLPAGVYLVNVTTDRSLYHAAIVSCR